jgi:hypothetical protein
MQDKLNKLLNDHTAKRQRAKDAEDAEEKGHADFKILAVNAIEKVIAPALNALCKILTGHGHQADVSLLTDTDSYPSAHLSFRVVDQDDPDGAASASRLSFSTSGSQDRFVVTTEIWGSEGREAESQTGKPESRPIAEVDTSWVTDQALSFVSCVLERA